MTGKPHTPGYTPRDLAELVAKHDREHPDHGDDCSCHNGLLTTLRIYFAPARLVVSDVPPPYVPPDARPVKTLKDDPRKPWLKRRAGETEAQHDYRISHSCYNCGTLIVDRAALNLHEDECSPQGKRATADE